MMIEGVSVDQLPSTWRYLPLGTFCDFSGGTQPPKTTFKEAPAEGYVRLLQIRDFETDRYAVYVPLNNRLRTISAEDISIARYGASVGRILTGKSGAINVAIMTTYPDESQIVKAFLCYALQHGDFQSYLTGLGGRAAQAGFNKGEVSRFKFPLPPVAEQWKIAAVLGLVQRAIEQQERLVALTTELKKTLLHKLFTEGLRGEPQKQTEIGPVPESWEQRPLEEAGQVVYGIQAAVASNLKPVGIKILTNKNITLDGKIILDAVNYFVLKTKRHHDTVLKKGDLLFNWRSGSKEHVGKTAYFDLDGEFTHSSFILRIRPTDEVTGKYLFYYLNFLRESGYFVKSQTFSVNAKFNKSAINRLPTYLPGDDERSEIVTTLDAVTRKIDVVESKRRLLEDLFRTLLHQLMTAQIRVNDLDLDEILRQPVAEIGDRVAPRAGALVKEGQVVHN